MNAPGIKLSKELQALLYVWQAGQTLLPQVARWAPFVKHQNTRPQNVLQHTHSLSGFAISFIETMEHEYQVFLDGYLLLAACQLHDYGEGALRLQEDVLNPDKTDNDDLREYRAFVTDYQDVPGFDTIKHKAYLLQHAWKQPQNFPPDAERIMESLCRENHGGVHAFPALEKLDYLLYALEQRIHRGNADLLAHVLNRQAPHLDVLSKKLLHLDRAYWSPEIKAQYLELAKGGNITIPGR